MEHVDLSIGDGELFVMLGPSGCGKTTTLRAMAGLERQTSGDIRIGSTLVNDLPPAERDIAMVFQFYALYPHLKTRDNLAFPLRAEGVPEPEVRERVAEAARMMRLEPLMDRRPQRLSGGEQQRVALARALVRRPQAFLMDEPLTNLDAELRADMRTEIKHLQAQLGTTMVYVTHDQVEAMSLGHRIAILNKGRVEQIGTPLEVYDRPASLFCAAFIGSPPMNLIDVEVADGCAARSRAGSSCPRRRACRATAPWSRASGRRRWRSPRRARIGAVPARVVSAEALGDEIIYVVDHGGSARRTRADATDGPLRRGRAGRPAARRRNPARLRREHGRAGGLMATVCERTGCASPSDEVQALDGVTLDVPDGSFFVVLGPSGAGKTTTLRAIAGLEKLDDGSVHLDGRDATGDAPAARDLAMVFQSYALYPRRTAYENIASPLRARKRLGRRDHRRRREGGGPAAHRAPAPAAARADVGRRAAARRAGPRAGPAARVRSSWTSRSPTST